MNNELKDSLKQLFNEIDRIKSYLSSCVSVLESTSDNIASLIDDGEYDKDTVSEIIDDLDGVRIDLGDSADCLYENIDLLSMLVFDEGIEP